MRHLVLIEFVEATAKHAVGQRLKVDKASAVSLVDVKKVAVRVDGPPTPPVAAPVPAADVDDVDDEPDAA